MKMAKNPNLPQELMIEIFSRLPAKSVGKCRCLSKSWRSDLSTSQFINLHLTRNTHQKNLILISQSHSLRTITIPIENDAVSKKLELLDTWTQVLGSCNGLVLLTNKKMDLCLVNPTTTQKVYIPKPDFNLGLKTGDQYIVHGFGYDCSSDDYKIVAIPTYSSSKIKPCDKYVYVYSVKMGVWNRVNSYATVHDDTVRSGAFINGAFHCHGKYASVIAAFDFANEVFYEILTPASTCGAVALLCVLKDRLCLVDIFCEDTCNTDVWMMEEYGSVESWAKLCSIDESVGIARPICFLGDDEILVTNIYEQSLILCNVKEGTVKELVVDGIPARFMDEGIFFESLVSLG